MMLRYERLVRISYIMAQRPKPKEQKKVIDATVIDEEILKYVAMDAGRQCGTT